jgi:hypothetical protein
MELLCQTLSKKQKQMIKTYKAPITHLNDDEVFAFGANEQGFHGGGAAGYASFGVTGNLWRSYNYHELPDGWKGKWNVKGKIGPQQGTEGKSFALVTVTRPGAKKSIKVDFKPLFECCHRNPQWKFYYAQSGEIGLNGWTPHEMAQFVVDSGTIPDNLYFDSTFAPFIIDKLKKNE